MLIHPLFTVTNLAKIWDGLSQKKEVKSRDKEWNEKSH